MMETLKSRIFNSLRRSNAGDDSPTRYQVMRRNIIILMYLTTFIPLLSMAFINYYQYRISIKQEVVNPLSLMSHKTAHSIELYLEERLSNIRALSASYTFEELSNKETLSRLFRIFKKELSGLVDLGIVDINGHHVAYSGPYLLLGKNYSKQKWFHEVTIRGVYISDVFMGYRGFPHIAIAVQQFDSNGQPWILRATIDTEKLDDIISAMGLKSGDDAFLINNKGILQTSSKFYGKVLEQSALEVPFTAGTSIQEKQDPKGRDIIISYTNLLSRDFFLVLIKPTNIAMKSWITLRNKMFFIFVSGSVLIFILVIKTSDFLINQIKESDEKREKAFRELENSQKLSSIGRLAAGVAHEINNPMAIINQKAGLMQDLIELDVAFHERDRFLDLTGSILQSVERCKKITHRLLGFARRMEVIYEKVSLNDLIVEVLGFLEQDALFRKVKIEMNLAEDLPEISTDIGQLEQAFLNIISNALAAVEDRGRIEITTWDENVDYVSVSIKDNGSGMTEEVRSHIFEPFFTTKTGYGTGLGLPITHGIINKLGGSIEVKSEIEVGTIFTVRLKKNKFEQGR
jgi:two-component system, NtrC family, sensor kinase